MPRQPRVPVRWGFVLMVGTIVFAVLGTAVYYGWEPITSDPRVRKNVDQVIKRTLGN